MFVFLYIVHSRQLIDITEILLKVALDTINQTKPIEELEQSLNKNLYLQIERSIGLGRLA
jgi:hypothetical protein